MTINSDYKIIHFIILIKEAEMIKSSLNSLYNTVKVDWTKFCKRITIEIRKDFEFNKELKF